MRADLVVGADGRQLDRARKGRFESEGIRRADGRALVSAPENRVAIVGLGLLILNLSLRQPVKLGSIYLPHPNNDSAGMDNCLCKARIISTLRFLFLFSTSEARFRPPRIFARSDALSPS